MKVTRARLTAVLRAHTSGLAVAVLVAGLAAFGLLEALEHWSLGAFFELRGPRTPRAPIVIVSIDESSFVELNEQWPFPRAMHGRLFETLAAGRPIAIGVDLIFDVPSARGEADDAALGASIARAGVVVLGAAPKTERQQFVTRQVPNIPLPLIRQGAAAVAPVNLQHDADGFVRRVPLRVPLGAQEALGLDARLHQMAGAAGLPVAPLPAAREVLINFRGGPRTYPWVPYYRVLRGEIPPETFRNALVLIGPTSGVLHDVFSTPFARGGDMPGVEIHANALETLISGDHVREVPRWISVVLAVAAAVAGSALVVRLHAMRALWAVTALLGVLALLALGGFVVAHVWLREVAGALALVLGYGATVVEHFVREQREKRRLSHFFSPEVLREVVRHRDEHSLGSSRRLVTVLFSDIRGFTSISEQLEPEQVAEMLREYLTEMTDIVFKHGGTVDKYIGDCIMALYNVPFEDEEHAVNAVRTALEFQERTLEVSARWQARLGISIRNGIGINTGEAIVGTLGSRQRLEYTAIGDTVNLASRLESITKDYQTAIVISESTHRYIDGHFVTRELGDVTVRGKTQPVKIYAVLPADIRKYPRATLETAATLTIAGGGAVRVATRDIGVGGIAVTGVPEEWQVGAAVEIRCEGGWLSKPIVAEGTIMWRRGGDAGIAFHSRDAESGRSRDAAHAGGETTARPGPAKRRRLGSRRTSRAQ